MLRTTQKSASINMKSMFNHSFLRFVVVAILGMFSTIMATAEKEVILTLKSGPKVSFVFSSKPCIATSDVELVITTADGQKFSYDYAEVCSITFGVDASTDINKITTQQVTFKTSPGVLTIYNLPVGESVSIYTLGGHCVAKQKQTAEGTILKLPVNVNGVLVVRTSTGISYRILPQ